MTRPDGLSGDGGTGRGHGQHEGSRTLLHGVDLEVPRSRPGNVGQADRDCWERDLSRHLM